MDKPTTIKLAGTLLALGAFAINAQAAPLQVGTRIGIDLGPTLTANWNNIPSNNAGVAAGSVVDLSGTAVDGVSITTSNAQFTNNDGTNNWVGLFAQGGGAPAEFVDSVTTDIAGNFNLGDGSPYTVVVSGLDDALSYDIVAVSTANYAPIDTVSINGGTPSAISRPSSQASGLFHSFSGVVTDGSGKITITVVDTNTTTNPILNGVLIKTVTPTPVNHWVLNGDGDWNTAANWSETTVPNAQSAEAVLDDDGGNITSEVTATLDVPVTLGALKFNHSFGYTVAGTNALTFDNAGGGARMEVQSGDHVISAPVTMAEALAATVGSDASLDLSGTLSDGGSAFGLVKGGTGNLILSGTFSGFAGLTTIKAGTVTLPRAGDYTLTHEFSGAGRLAFNGGGRVTLAPASFNDHGGTDVSNGTTLVVDSAADLGSGGVGFDNGTLEVTADVTAGTGGWVAGAGGGTVDVASGFTLGGGRLTGTGAMTKTGEGTWKILTGGAIAHGSTVTVKAGTLDLEANDVFGNHGNSQTDLTIGAGALVINGEEGFANATGFNAFRDLTLNGGELRITDKANATFPSYALKRTVTVVGSAASLITDPGNLADAAILIGNLVADTQTTFDVENVTASPAVDLTVSAVLRNNVSGVPVSTGLRKTGAGTMQLTRLNTYTGNTSVDAGTLIIDQAFLADAADVELTTGATLQLDFDGTDTIDELFIDGLPQDSGTWGRTGHPTAEHTTSLIAGDGLLEVTTDPPAGYAGWAGLFAGFTNTAADFDFENDGLASGIEWVVDGDPTANDAAAVAPTFDNTTDPANFLFTFRRRDDAATDPNTSIVVEYGSDLSGWTPAQAGWITVDDNGFGTSAIDGVGVDKVTVAIPRSIAIDGKLFVRLNVAVTTIP